MQLRYQTGLTGEQEARPDSAAPSAAKGSAQAEGQPGEEAASPLQADRVPDRPDTSAAKPAGDSTSAAKTRRIGRPAAAVLPVVLYNGAPRWRAPQEIGDLIAPVAEELAPYQPWQRYLVIMPAGEELPAMESLEEVRMTLKERLREWPAQWMREGREQGLEHERALLCRMAALRFGADTSERLAALLANVAEADRLADIGDRLVQCRAADEFLTQAELTTRPID